MGIDMTPTWEAIADIQAQVLLNPNSEYETRRMALRYIRWFGQVMDAMKNHMEPPPQPTASNPYEFN